jgi:hypothetical protein
MMADHDQTPDEALGGSQPPSDEPTDDVAPPTDEDDVVPSPESEGSRPPEGNAPLLERGDEWMNRWNEIQIRFVDEPRESIANADALVDEVMKELAAAFAEERARIEGEWSAGSEPSTEELRVALQRYRSFFNRLLAA